jgi:hypothetical protein
MVDAKIMGEQSAIGGRTKKFTHGGSNPPLATKNIHHK